jgi:hypothetical protein
MKQILFFALKEDLLTVLDTVEKEGPLKYIRMSQSANLGYECFACGAEIPDLGKASAESAINCESFVVTERAVSVNMRSIRSTVGIERYCVDQLVNPDSITFTPAGIWSPDIVLHGRVATVSESAISQALIRRFNSAIRAHFGKVKAFWVGPQARALLDAGKRLTISAHSPCDFDLTTTP